MAIRPFAVVSRYVLCAVGSLIAPDHIMLRIDSRADHHRRRRGGWYFYRRMSAIITLTTVTAATNNTVSPA